MYRKHGVCLVLISQSLIHIQQDIDFICCFDHVFVTLERRKRSYSLYAGACAHYKIPFISCIFVASSDMRFSCSYDWIYIYRNWIPRPFRDQRKSLFLHPKEMFASSSWCKHFLFGLRRRGKKNIERFLNAQFFCHWKRNLTQCECVYCGQQ